MEEKRRGWWRMWRGERERRVVSSSELRSYLEERLPEYMIPAAFVMMEELPLTEHGKVDRRALPEPDRARPELEKDFVAPRTDTEEVLASIWSRVLGVERVGIHDNFFDLGGDSIRSIQVLSLAQERGLSLTVQQLFQYQTIHGLAQNIRTSQHTAQPKPKTERFGLISELDRSKLATRFEDAYPLAMLQAGMLFHSEYASESAIYHDIFSYHLRVPFDLQILRAALQRLAANTSYAAHLFRHDEFQPAAAISSCRCRDSFGCPRPAPARQRRAG